MDSAVEALLAKGADHRQKSLLFIGVVASGGSDVESLELLQGFFATAKQRDQVETLRCSLQAGKCKHRENLPNAPKTCGVCLAPEHHNLPAGHDVDGKNLKTVSDARLVYASLVQPRREVATVDLAEAGGFLLQLLPLYIGVVVPGIRQEEEASSFVCTALDRE